MQAAHQVPHKKGKSNDSDENETYKGILQKYKIIMGFKAQLLIQ